MTVGERIRDRRKELGLTQEALAKRLDCGKAAICRVEKEENNITTDRIIRFAKALETTPADLMGWVSSDIDILKSESAECRQLIEILKNLNHDGQKRLLNYAEDLYKIESYLK